MLVLLVLLAACSGAESPAPQAMPSLVGQPLRDARATLEEAGIAYRVDGHDDERSIVTSQFPAATEQIVDPSRTRVTTSTPLEMAATECANFATNYLGDEGYSMTLNMAGETDRGQGRTSREQVECVLGELDVPDAVWSKMLATRALDGQLSDNWGDVEATWRYHPDTGLDIVLEIER